MVKHESKDRSIPVVSVSPIVLSAPERGWDLATASLIPCTREPIAHHCLFTRLRLFYGCLCSACKLLVRTWLCRHPTYLS